MKTYDDAIDEAINLMATHTFVSMGECSASKLVKCGAPTVTSKLYIAELEKLRGGSGEYADGLGAAIKVLETHGARRGRNGPMLVQLPPDHTDQHMSLYISRLQALLYGGG